MSRFRREIGTAIVRMVKYSMARRNIVDPFDPVYLRRSSKNGYSGIKNIPWSLLKIQRPDTNLFDDLVFAKMQLDAGAAMLQTYLDLLVAAPLKFDPSIINGHWELSVDDVQKMVNNFREESEAIPDIWRLIKSGDYVPPATIKYFYSTDRMSYEPSLKPENVSPLHVDFMSRRDRAQYKYLEDLRKFQAQNSSHTQDDDDDDIVLVDVEDE
jgi:hypothetical protein